MDGATSGLIGATVGPACGHVRATSTQPPVITSAGPTKTKIYASVSSATKDRPLGRRRGQVGQAPFPPSSATTRHDIDPSARPICTRSTVGRPAVTDSRETAPSSKAR